jgi:hypothetical protein
MDFHRVGSGHNVYLGIDPGAGREPTKLCVIQVQVLEELAISEAVGITDLIAVIAEIINRHNCSQAAIDTTSPYAHQLKALLQQSHGEKINGVRFGKEANSRSYIVHIQPALALNDDGADAQNIALIAATEGVAHARQKNRGPLGRKASRSVRLDRARH